MTGRRAALGLGANLGDARAALRSAVRAVAEIPGVRLAGVSSLYRTPPVGGPEQPDYLNAVVVVSADVPAESLLRAAHRIEAEHHRTREVRWGPRTLDIDVLAVAGTVSGDPSLTLPHPRAHERAFVLVPWAEVDPDFVVPGAGPVAGLLAGLPPAEREGVSVICAGSGWALGADREAVG